jgi:hypothetical protein
VFNTHLVIESLDTTVDELYTALYEYAQISPTIEIYRKTEMPERYHYKHNARIGDVIIVGKLGYYAYMRSVKIPNGRVIVYLKYKQ